MIHISGNKINELISKYNEVSQGAKLLEVMIASAIFAKLTTNDRPETVTNIVNELVDKFMSEIT